MTGGLRDFWSLFDDVERIEIPLLQRDYAQGRDREREVRRRFVDALAGALGTDEGRSLDLDFVYGRVSGGCLEPLDGQQRLTTLFLLYWYAAASAGKIEDFQNRLRDDHRESRFGYRTRPSARALFDALVREKGPAPEELAGDGFRPSAWLQDQPWFALGWLRDPTVLGCHTMLDALHERLRASPSAWGRLVPRSSIRFQLLRLKDLGLGDELYLKMNGRGKRLTRFEVWKAEIEQWLAEHESSLRPRTDGNSWRDYVARSFDGAWLRFMWKRPRPDKANVDELFHHFIRAAALVSRVVADGPDLRAQIEALIDESEPTFLLLSELGCVDACFVQTFATLLDRLVQNRTPRFLGHVGHLDEEALFDRVLRAKGERETGGLTLADWVELHAWCKLLLLASPSLGADELAPVMHDWTRVISNLAHNSDLDRIESVVAALRGVERAAIHADKPELVVRNASGDLDFDGFNRVQRDEERLKAALIVRDARWREALERAERHPYFRGGIAFLLRFAGIWDRWAPEKRCDWSDGDDDALRLEFDRWYRKAAAVFAPHPPETPELLWERALLATGDYLLKRGSNWNLLRPRDRDASWKRLLQADTKLEDREERRDVVRRVLERVEPDDVKGSLGRIVAGGVGAGTGPDDWRAMLVREPRHLAYCTRRNLRWPDDSERVLLLQGERVSAMHTDLHLHELWLRIHDRGDDGPWREPLRPEARGDKMVRLQLESKAPGVTVEAVKPANQLDITLRIVEGAAQPAQGPEGWSAGEPGVYRRSTATVAEALEAIDRLIS